MWIGSTRWSRLLLQPGVGIVGAKLYFADRRIQHAGLVLGVGGVAGHSFRFFDNLFFGHFGHAVLPRHCSAVTAACMATRREVWEEVGRPRRGPCGLVQRCRLLPTRSSPGLADRLDSLRRTHPLRVVEQGCRHRGSKRGPGAARIRVRGEEMERVAPVGSGLQSQPHLHRGGLLPGVATSDRTLRHQPSPARRAGPST